jgi:hypothetical protein
MKIIIAGGRGVTDYTVLLNAITWSGYWGLHRRSIEVVCGMAAGADMLGMEFANRNGLVVHEFPADWDQHGRAAGHIRNAQMGQFAKDNGGKLLALWDGKSRGTAGMITWAQKNLLEHYVHRTAL